MQPLHQPEPVWGRALCTDMFSHGNYHPRAEGLVQYSLEGCVDHTTCIVNWLRWGSCCDIRHRRPYILGAHSFNISLCCFGVLILFTACSGLVATPSTGPDAHAGLLATAAASLFTAPCFQSIECRCCNVIQSKSITTAWTYGWTWCSLCNNSLPLGRLAGVGSFSAAAFCSTNGY